MERKKNTVSSPQDSLQVRAAHDNKVFRLLVEGVRDYAIFLLDSGGYISSWNVGAERIKGYRADEIIGQHFSRFYTDEAIAAQLPQRELETATEVGRFEGEGWRLRKDGSSFWASVVINSLYDENGDVYGFAKVTRDMSERRRWEEDIKRLNRELSQRVEQLARANLQLAEKSAENEMFVYSVSHDMRAPLVNLQGFGRELRLSAAQLEKLLAEAALPDELRDAVTSLLKGDFSESITYIDSAVVHLSTIIEALLRLSRAGSLQYRWEEVDVAAIVRRIADSLRHTIGTLGAQVDIGELPQVTADAASVEQVFSNLLQNSLNYRDPSRPLHIEIGALGPPSGESGMRDAGERTFFVRDNGLGIPLELQSKLFKPFKRFHPESSGGEGIGLSIVKKIVDRHNGKVRVESAPGVGSTFYVTFPFPMLAEPTRGADRG